MTIAARTIGGPGAGKTERGSQITGMVLEKLVKDPLRIGFISFTRAARREAAARVADKFGIPISTLEKHGYFRTLHSTCYKHLGIAHEQLLGTRQGDTDWLRAVLDDEKVRTPGAEIDDDYLHSGNEAGDAARALFFWDVARNRQSTLLSVWEPAARIDDRTPDLGFCQEVIEKYERAKGEDDRLDFADLLMRYAGKRWSGNHHHPFADAPPEGTDPMIPVWLHDEAQDMSLLTSLVFKRLCRFSQWVYLMGDSWQSVYGWAGADGRIFADWPVAKEEVLPLSYRCPSRVLDFSNDLMHRSGMRPRDFHASAKGGEVLRSSIETALYSIERGQDTLVLARTNQYAQMAAKILDDRCLPWKSVKGGNGPQAPARMQGVSTIVNLRSGQRVTGDDLWRMLDLLPSKSGGSILFERGTKAWFDEEDNRKRLLPVELANLDAVGATAACKELIASGKYRELLEAPAARMAAAAEVHGVKAIQNPSVKIGTCHSSKGLGADHVVLINRLPWPTQQAIEDPAVLDEERRVWYVSATRAKERLTIAEGEGQPFEEL